MGRAPDGAIFALGRVGRGTVLLRSFTGPLTLLPFGAASIRGLPFIALAAVSSSEVLLLGPDGRIDRLLSDRLEPMYRPSTPLIPTAEGRIVAVGRGAVALIPQTEGGATGPNLLVEVDGVGPVRRFVGITLPMLSPVILFNVLMAVIGSFQVFTQAFVMTGGEPGDSTRFYVLYLFNQGFEYYEMGYASAMAWLLLLGVMAVTAVILRSSARYVYYEALRK